MEVLKQGKSEPVPVEKQVAILYAVVRGILTDVNVKDVAEYEQGLFKRLDQDPDGAAAMRTIREKGVLDEEAENALKSALTAYTQEFIKNRNR